MYLCFVSVHTPGAWANVDEVRAVLTASTTPADRLQHAYLESGPDALLFSLYLHAPDRREALLRAEQLCRRTMASLLPARQWCVRSTRGGL